MLSKLTVATVSALVGSLTATAPQFMTPRVSNTAAVEREAMPPQNGVRCPNGFDSNWNSSTKVLKCSKSNTTWVLTACTDPMYLTYNQRSGRDNCTPTQAPGLGNPVASGTRAITCTAPGYTIQNDKVGTRDRCERTESQWAYPNQL